MFASLLQCEMSIPIVSQLFKVGLINQSFRFCSKYTIKTGDEQIFCSIFIIGLNNLVSCGMPALEIIL